jgi:hypothetical protein
MYTHRLQGARTYPDPGWNAVLAAQSSVAQRGISLLPRASSIEAGHEVNSRSLMAEVKQSQ